MIFRRVDIVPIDETMHWRVVQLVVQHSSSKVLYSVFNRGNDKYDDKRYGKQTRVGCSENCKYLCEIALIMAIEVLTARLTERIMMNKKYIFAMLWNWNHRFLGTNDKGVYFAVLILFLP